MSGKIKILDFLVHGGHQYEFFKNDAIFYCMGVNNELHTYKSLGRPEQSNVNFIQKDYLEKISPDIVMIRSGVNPSKLEPFVKMGSKPIAVIQTTRPFKIPDWCNIVVWNSKKTMDDFKDQIPYKKHFYVVHGFDPNEFCNKNINKNNRVLSSFSLFKQRGDILGFNNWNYVNNNLKICDVIGHGNEEIPSNMGTFKYPELVSVYNSYSIYLNTTTQSAMPRSRGEAMMCGMPIITTSFYDSNIYFKHKINSLIADTKYDMINCIKLLLSNKNLINEISLNGIETAIKFFNINDYIKKWDFILKL